MREPLRVNPKQRRCYDLWLPRLKPTRPQENPGVSETGPRTQVDFAARSMDDLAGQLGA